MDALQRKQDLLDAVRKGDLPLLGSLLRAGGDINAIYPNGKTLLINAILGQKMDVIEFLVGTGANLDQRDFYDRTPLMYAADQGSLSITRFLLGAGADVNARNKQGRTTLMYAAYKDLADITEALLDAGAEINARDNKDRSVWTYSTYKRSFKVQNLLKKRGADTRPPAVRSKRAWKERFKANLTVDEFTELKSSSAWGCGTIFSTTINYLILVVLQFVWNPLAWLFTAGFAWNLTLTFPSLSKLLPLARELLRMRAGKTLRMTSAGSQSLPEFDTSNNVDFVSNLMELGSRELKSVHITHPGRQSRQMKSSIFVSRLLSALLALSILALAIMLFKPGLTGQDYNTFRETPYAIQKQIAFLVALPLWIRVTQRLERGLRMQRLRMVQRDRDRIAGEISELLNAEDFKQKELPSHFGLYLRAFMTTDRLHIKGFDLETMLAYSIAPTLPLLALGKPGEHLGSGRIRTSDEHWQDEILRLMDASRLILIIPSHRGGTLWEIATLRDRGYFEKTIFIMPPELDFHGGKYSSDWKKTVAAARGVGVEFPEHIPTGAFFRLHGDGSFEDYAPFAAEEFLEEFDLSGQGGDYGHGDDDGNGDPDNGDGDEDGDGDSADGSDSMDGLDTVGDSGLDADGIDGGDVDGGGTDGGDGGDGGGNGGNGGGDGGGDGGGY